jgi:hypothetical protein
VNVVHLKPWICKKLCLMGKGKNSSTTAKKTAEKRALEVPEMAAATQI